MFLKYYILQVTLTFLLPQKVVPFNGFYLVNGRDVLLQPSFTKKKLSLN